MKKLRKLMKKSINHDHYILGYTRTTMLRTKGSKLALTSKSHKPWLRSERRLQLDNVKAEALVISGQHTAVNTFPGLVHTARHTMKLATPEAVTQPLWRRTSKVGLMTGVKSTR